MNCKILEESRSTVLVVGPDLRRHELQPRTLMALPWPLLVDWRQEAGRASDHASSSRNERPSFRFRSAVTLIVQDEAARVLDTQRGNFYVLDAIGTQMLFATLESGSEAMVHTLALAYGVSIEQLREDWGALVEEFNRAGLVEPVRFQSSHFKLPGRCAVWMRLTLAWLSFCLLGWEKTIRIWRRRACSRVDWTSEEGQSAIAALDGLVRRLASRHPLNPQCKERALVSYHFLKRMGVPARLVMGVMLYPFTAHAWTECHGRIVGDDEARCEQFTPVAIYE